MGSLSVMSLEQPRSRVVIPAVAALLTLVAVGCGGGGTSAGKAPAASYLAAVTRAAHTTAQVPGY
jgi:hypothetical protein